MNRWLKRVSYVLLAVVFFCMIFSGCGKKPGDNMFNSDRFRIVEINGNSSTETVDAILVDTETNVLYIWVRDLYAGGLTPLLNSSGEVQFYQNK